MKKITPRTKPATEKKAKTAKRGAKMKPVAAGARKASGTQAPGMDSLAETIRMLGALVAELRQIADDLRDLMTAGEEPEVDALVVTEIEGSEALEE